MLVSHFILFLDQRINQWMPFLNDCLDCGHEVYECICSAYVNYTFLHSELLAGLVFPLSD